MKLLTLADLHDLKTQKEVKEHIVSQYTHFHTDEGKSNEQLQLERTLKDYIVLIAYESVGSWGCESTSYFLLKHKYDNTFHEVHGSHCSCYGFEGQFTPQKTELAYLKSNMFNFYSGGYDDHNKSNTEAVITYISKL